MYFVSSHDAIFTSNVEHESGKGKAHALNVCSLPADGNPESLGFSISQKPVYVQLSCAYIVHLQTLHLTHAH